jgi:hypothetical protein
MPQKLHPRPALDKAGASDIPLELTNAFSAIVGFLLTRVRAELAAREGQDADPWIPHPRWPWSRRKARQLAASGAIKGVRKVGKDWLARQSAIDAFIEEHGVEVPASMPANDGAPAGDMEADVDRVLSELGLERVASALPRAADARKGRGR